MIGSQQNRNVPPLGLPQRVPERGPLEPRASQFAQRTSVASHLEERRILRAPVRELVHKIEHQSRNPILRQVRGKPAQETLAVSGGEYLLIAHRNGFLEQGGEVFLEKFLLMGIEADIILDPPPFRVTSRKLAREETAEDGVPGVGRRGGQYGEIVGSLNIETRAARNSAPTSTDSGGRSSSPP